MLFSITKRFVTTRRKSPCAGRIGRGEEKERRILRTFGGFQKQEKGGGNPHFLGQEIPTSGLWSALGLKGWQGRFLFV